MSTTKSTFDPAFSDAEREELGHLDYLDARLDELRDRGLIAPEAYATVVAESQGRRQAIELSGTLSQRHHPGEETRQERPARCSGMGRVCAGAGSVAGRGLEPGRRSQLGPWRPRRCHRPLRAGGRALSAVCRPSWTGSRRRKSNVAEEERSEGRTGSRKRAKSRDGSRRPGGPWRAAATPRSIALGQQILARPPRPRRRAGDHGLCPAAERAARPGARVLQGFGALAAVQQDLVAVGAKPAASRHRAAARRRRRPSSRRRMRHAIGQPSRAPCRSRRAAAAVLVVELRGRVPQGALARAAPLPGRALDRGQLDRRRPHAAGRLALVSGGQVRAGDGRDLAVRGVWSRALADGAPTAPAG